MDLPHGRILQGNAFEQHVLAAIRLNELRPQIVPLAEYSFAHGYTFLAHLKERGAGLRLVGIAFLPPALAAPFPRPPALTASLPIDPPFAAHAAILLPKSI